MPGDMLEVSLAAEIAAGFGLGTVLSWQRIPQGLMNANWRMTTGTGRYAVKQLRDRPPATVREVHRVLPQLAMKDIPVPLPCSTEQGDTLLGINNEWYCASGWMPGAHLNGHDLPMDACAELGAVCGRLHTALAAVLPEAPDRLPDCPTSTGEAQVRLEHYAQAAGRRAGDRFDDLARREIQQRQILLNRVADRQPSGGEVGPAGWTHGDLQPLNILVDPSATRVNAILDWDRLDVRGYAAEIVRTATIWFTDTGTGALDLERIAAFIRGYRARRSISDAQLVDAAHRRWWDLVTGTWQLHRHYEQQDRGCDYLFFSDGQLLRWWFDHSDTVNEALTASTLPH
ncbi:phosphotransferase [Paractinoplanes hotanensis]|uniref:Phosphotransferase n=1 Tax=Paractinoplanes hotanensis TaxID=2906497 RepID=A0ABT0Y889_9ACTN|nr:phosphotransferase [Actinoplanes hotanensis]MCM4082254.1 phosphotransferase [Actinoplanes hotanensis]